MRKAQVVILRLFLDSETPGVLRGMLQCIPEDEVLSFAGEESLLAALRQISEKALDQTTPELSRRNTS